jgi:hypothetical protein
MRACWEAADTTGSLGPGAHASVGAALVPVMAAAGASTGRPVRTFVPVASGNPADDGRYPGVAVLAAAVEEAALPPAVRPRRIPGAWSLWGDFEP